MDDQNMKQEPMQERARLAGGTLSVESALGQGTTVTVTFPVVPHA